MKENKITTITQEKTELIKDAYKNTLEVNKKCSNYED